MYQYYLFVDIYLVLGKYLIFFPTMLKMYKTVENFTETYTLPYSNAKAEPPGTCLQYFLIANQLLLIPLLAKWPR